MDNGATAADGPDLVAAREKTSYKSAVIVDVKR
jgi:hypothetical protein